MRKRKSGFTWTRRTVRTPEGYEAHRRKVPMYLNEEAVRELDEWWQHNATALELPEREH